LIAFFGWWYIRSSLQQATYLSDDERAFAGPNNVQILFLLLSDEILALFPAW
jgi:hypothetical protein